MDLRNVVRSVWDFPKKGVLYRDITSVLIDPDALRASVDQLIDLTKDLDFDLIVCPESRGYVFGVPMCYVLGKGFVPMRKAGKLPFETISKTYGLEYGQATIEMHKDAIRPGQKVIVVDDLLATGGTCEALCELIEEAGGIVSACLFLIELEYLKGREVLAGYEIRSVIQYE